MNSQAAEQRRKTSHALIDTNGANVGWQVSTIR